ncbi:MAG: hypothetical protein HS122_17970 [Opitutaceae bacterium]|nr:hypothetical protein [Opitutaceae bacterium]
MKPTRLTVGLVGLLFGTLLVSAGSMRIDPANVTTIFGFISAGAALAFAIGDYGLMTRGIHHK